jgi:hypothetical protein
MVAIHKQNQIFTPIVGATFGSREGMLLLPGRSSELSVIPNSSQTLRHLEIKATALALVLLLTAEARAAAEEGE